MKFERYSADGNAFVWSPLPVDPREIPAICQSEGDSDGLWWWNAPKHEHDHKSENFLGTWSFYNRDGSKAYFCGNASRCAGAWAKSHHLKGGDWSFQCQTLASQKTVATIIHVREEGENFRVQLPSGEVVRKELTPVGPAYVVQAGVEHWVFMGVFDGVFDGVTDITRKKILEIAPVLRTQTSANLTFFTKSGLNTAQGSIQIATFERGVEDITKSCGSGLYAATLLLAQRHPNISFFDFQSPGGHARVEKRSPNTSIAQWDLVGSAHRI